MALDSDPDGMVSEWFEVSGLRVLAKIGVPEVERSRPQAIAFNVRFQIRTAFRDLHDELGRTVDYGSVTNEIRVAAEENQAQLIETLVGEVADRLMARFPLSRVEVELKKFVLPDTEYVSVRTARVRRKAENRGTASGP
ncbi:MAG TPA: dihydroneopterin aldolase [Chthoniobacterales bacterium]|nr:dihydroneopterin aldolase [Chthoniobacterales bacterium]